MSFQSVFGKGFFELGVIDKMAPGLQKAEARIKQFGTKLASLGKDMMLGGAVVGSGFVLASAKAADFEHQMARVKALSGATGETFAGLSEQAKELGRTTQYTAIDSAKAMGVFALAGNKADDIMKVMPATLDLAAAGMIDAGDAAYMANNIMKGMHIAPEDMGKAVDVMAMAMTTANMDLQQLADSMKYVAPVAHGAQMSLEETAAAIQMLSDSGMQGDIAGTSLRGMLMSLTNPSAEAKEALDKIGFSVRDQNGEMRSFENIVRDLQDGINGLGSADQLKAIGQIFPNRQAAAAFDLVSKGAEEYGQRVRMLQDSEGAAERLRKVQMNTTKGSWIIFKSAVEGAMISIGEALNGPVRAGIQFLTTLVIATSHWVETHKATVAVVAGGVGAFTAAGAAMFGLGIAINVTGKALGVASNALKVFRYGWQALLILLNITVGIFSLLFTWPGIIIGAIVGFVAVMAAASGELGRAFSWIKEKIGEIVGTVQDTISGIYNAFTAGDLGLAAAIAGKGMQLAFVQTGEAIANIFGGSLKDISEMIAKVYKFIGQLIGRINEARQSTVNWLSGKIGWLVGVDASELEIEAQAASAAAAEWTNSWDELDIDELSSSISDALDPEKVKQELAALNAEAEKIIEDRQREADELAKRPEKGDYEPFEYVEPALDDVEKSKSSWKDHLGSYSAAMLGRGVLQGIKINDPQKKMQKDMAELLKTLKQTNVILTNLVGPLFGT